MVAEWSGTPSVDEKPESEVKAVLPVLGDRMMVIDEYQHRWEKLAGIKQQ